MYQDFKVLLKRFCDFANMRLRDHCGAHDVTFHGPQGNSKNLLTTLTDDGGHFWQMGRAGAGQESWRAHSTSVDSRL